MYNHSNVGDAGEFDLKLAIECANAYAASTGLGCTVSDVTGQVIHNAGLGCSECTICDTVGKDRNFCMQAHAYGMAEAERFGGKYIYFCPMGLSCFVSPIVGDHGSAAKITVGPFLMVELEDFTAFELEYRMKLNPSEIEYLLQALENVPYIPPEKVNALSNILFMAVSFMNNVSAANRMLEHQTSDAIQSHISDYIHELKRGEELPHYPLETERQMLNSIVESDKPKAQQLLNELLGYILFSSGGDFSRIRTRVYELLVVISRAAADAGASPDKNFELTYRFMQSTQRLTDIDSLSYKLVEIMNQFIDSIFSFQSEKNADVMYKAMQYIHQNYAEKITLENVADVVGLSASYFSKVFKKETGTNFNAYLNMLRIEKSKKLLMYEDIRLVSIASMVGYEDQSYFTRVFKRLTGSSPNQYRKSGVKFSAWNKQSQN